MNNIDNNRPAINPWLIWSLATLFYAYRFVLDVFPGVATHGLITSFGTNAMQLGYLAAFYFYAYILLQIPTGILLDRFGARRLVIFATAVTTLGCFIFATAKIFAIAALGRLISGFGASFAVVSALYVSATWLPIHRYAFAAGLVVMIGMLGAACGEAPIALLVAKIDWRNTLFIFTIFGALLTLLLWKFMRDKPQEISAKPKTNKHLLHGLKVVCKDPQSWLLAIYSSLLFMPTVVFGSLWGIPFVQRRLQVGNTEAALVVSTLFIGWVFGAPFWGWFSDKIKSRKIPMLVGGFFATICMTLVIFLPNVNSLIINTLLFGFSFFSGGMLVSFASAREIHARENTGAVTGFMNTINMVAGTLGQPLVGFLLDFSHHNVATAGLAAYPLADFQHALMILPAAMLLGTVLLFWIRETYKFRLEGS